MKESPPFPQTALLSTALVVSNLPVAGTVLWLVPGLARKEAGIWLLLGVAAILILRARHQLFALQAELTRAWFLLPFILFSGISILWSVAPEVSAARWLVLLSTIVVGGCIGLAIDRQHLLRYLAVFLTIVLLFSTLVVLLVPQVGVMNYYTIQGAWKGIYWHKNHMGIIGGLACTVFLCAAIAGLQFRRRSTWVWGALYALSLLFVVQTDSVASYLSLIGVHGLMLVVLLHLKYKSKLRRMHYAVLGGVLLILIGLLWVNLDMVFGAFNRSTNLTGRVPMWGYMFRLYLAARLWGGYGFNAFWHIASHRITMQHLARYPDPIVIADNGFIDILMSTGVFGLILFLVFYAGLWTRAARHAWNATDMNGLFPLIVMAYGLLANLTWSLLFENESFMMLVMIALTFAISTPRAAEASRANASAAESAS